MDDITKHDPHEPLDPDENPRVAYEHGDADVFTVSKYGIALAFGVIFAAGAMWGLFEWFQHNQMVEESPVSPSVMKERPKLPPTPRLQMFPKRDLKDFRAAEAHHLENFGWIDPNKGIVHIPIEQAIDAVAKQGLPSKPLQPTEGLDAEGYRLLPEKSSSGRTVEKVAQ
ncbi:MAG: hypothetical protein JWO80_957 [Bryobacterales bacterium]|nr:hypothetical protein [Bryobacterales bacterium]